MRGGRKIGERLADEGTKMGQCYVDRKVTNKQEKRLLWSRLGLVKSSAKRGYTPLPAQSLMRNFFKRSTRQILGVLVQAPRIEIYRSTRYSEMTSAPFIVILRSPLHHLMKSPDRTATL